MEELRDTVYLAVQKRNKHGSTTSDCSVSAAYVSCAVLSIPHQAKSMSAGFLCMPF